MRPVFSRLLVAAVATALALAGAEVLVRGIRPQEALVGTPGMYRPSATVGHEFAAGYRGVLTNLTEYNTSVSITDLGTRADSTRTGDGRITALFLGDSFIFGQGVEAHEALPAVVARRLGDVRAVNAGVPGYGTVEAVSRLVELAAATQAHVVILGVFLGNDLVDNGFVPGERSAFRMPRDTWWRPLADVLYRHSHLYRLARSLPWRGTSSTEDVLRNYREVDDSLRAVEMARTSEALARFSHLADSLDLRALAILMPDRIALQKPNLKPSGTALDSVPVVWTHPNTVFGELLDQVGVPYLDLTPAFEATGRSSDFFFPLDGHWNAAGHALAGEAVAEWLRTWVDGPGDSA